MKKLSFVIPCYRSAHIIPDVTKKIAEIYAGQDYEIILINDSSPDDTFGAIQKICEENPHVIGIDLSKNFGQHSAILAGLHEVSGDIIICMDDDGQTPPEEAYKLIEAVEAGHDIAIAKYQHKKHSFLRNLGSKVNDKMAKALIGKPRDLFLSSFVAFKPFIAKQICQYTFPYPYISGMLLRASNDIVNVEVNHKSREVGESGYTFGKLMALWFNGFTNFSLKPLRVATVLGMIIAIVGFLVGIYAVVVKIMNPDAPLGWASMMSATVFIGGIILLLMGLIGEYIGRMFMGLNQQPQYVIRTKIKHEKEK
ncbi:MAG: glycosyltransferase family 2 protein [Christensenellaceae bacterium]